MITLSQIITLTIWYWNYADAITLTEPIDNTKQFRCIRQINYINQMITLTEITLTK